MPENSSTEFDIKQNQIKDLLAGQGLDALLLQRVSSFAWATCGAASYINTASSDGAASLLVTPTDRHVITTNIEATRLEQEEMLVAQGWELQASPWYSPGETVANLTKGLRLGADSGFPGAADLSSEIGVLRSNLQTSEVVRFRTLSKLCADAMDSAIRQVRPGMSEYQIAAILGHEAQSRGAQPIVNLIATDERIYRFRHPLPTKKQMERYAMLVLCGRKWGLVCSITRLVHFGRLPDNLRRKADALAHIDATFIHSTRPGVTLAQAFHHGVQAYSDSEYPDEWQLHHQGGPAGYEPREIIATPEADFHIAAGQVYAWNPSITGAKVEDTILVGTDSNEVLTAIAGWPVLLTKVTNQVYSRPAILEIIE